MVKTFEDVVYEKFEKGKENKSYYQDAFYYVENEAWLNKDGKFRTSIGEAVLEVSEDAPINPTKEPKGTSMDSVDDGLDELIEDVLDVNVEEIKEDTSNKASGGNLEGIMSGIKVEIVKTEDKNLRIRKIFDGYKRKEDDLEGEHDEK